MNLRGEQRQTKTQNFLSDYEKLPPETTKYTNTSFTA